MRVYSKNFQCKVATYIDNELRDELNNLAERDGISSAQLVRELIIMALDDRKAWKPLTVKQLLATKADSYDN